MRVRLGMTVQTLTDELAQELGYEGLSGVIVTEVRPGSAADDGGLERGMLVREVNHRRIRNVRDFNNAMDLAREERDTVLLLIRMEGMDQFVVLNLSD